MPRIKAMQEQGAARVRPLVVITGGSSGIGRSTAKAFAAEGHPLLLISRRIEPLPELGADRVIFEQADVVDYQGIVVAVRKAEKEFGTTGCLVNNAGVVDARDFRDIYYESYSHEIDVNLKGVLNCTKAVLGGMIANRAGTIINISSVSDRKTSPVAVAYTATKYAVRDASCWVIRILWSRINWLKSFCTAGNCRLISVFAIWSSLPPKPVSRRSKAPRIASLSGDP